MDRLHTRRSLMVGIAAGAAILPKRVGSGQSSGLAFGYPVGLAGRSLGDGFIVRHGYATENVWYNPGWLHAGEDWYLIEGETGGTGVYAAAAGEVVFAGSEYPGLVVIVRHGGDLYSMYGHLDYALPVGVGDRVERGDPLGTVLPRTDGRAPSHLHFEMRTFLTTTEVNGDAPRYSVGCGFNCVPGPGYWPSDAPEHPSAMGWRNPTHVIGGRTGLPTGGEAVVAASAADAAELWSAPEDGDGAARLASMPLAAGDHYPLLAIEAGSESSEGTSAEAYRLWYRIALAEGGSAWVRAALPFDRDAGSDGRASSVRFDFLPAVAAT